MFIPHRKDRLLERPALDPGQEIREFLVCGQLVAFFYMPASMVVRRGLEVPESAAS
jgi:hypothetical protein